MIPGSPALMRWREGMNVSKPWACDGYHFGGRI